jgi:hypothetical protein
MTFYRLIKPDWAKPTIKKENNPEFVKEVAGPNVIEGCIKPQDVTELNKQGYNAYWFPNHPDTNVYENKVKYLSGSMINVFNYVFVDMDLKDGVYKDKAHFLSVLEAFPVKPTLTVSSGNGVHAYWRIENLTRDQYVITQMALINHFNTDPSVYTVLQLMRLPGSLNTKNPNEFKIANIVDLLSSGEAYESVGVFPKEIFNIPEERMKKAQLHLDKLDGKIVLEFNEVNIDELPDKFLDLIESNYKIKEIFEDPFSYNGDRSSADMALANMLFHKGFHKDDAVKVLANTQKGLAKGNNRKEYAQNTVHKAYNGREQKPQQSVAMAERPSKFKNASQLINEKDTRKRGRPVNGPYFLDGGVLHKQWSRTQLLGIIAGTGVGKTAFTLFMFKEMIKNNPDNDDIFSFHTLEMPAKEIADRWLDLVGHNSPYSDRLYVIPNEDEEGNPRNIGLQEMYEDIKQLESETGKKVHAMAVDHIGILAKHIDIRKEYNFGIMSEDHAGYSDIRTMSLNRLCTELKTLAKMLDVFIVPLTQTTKEKGVGDLPIDKDGAYGISQYENIMDYIVTIWQPLMRVHKDIDERLLAYQYVKIRHKHKNDKIQTHSPKLLTYNTDTGDLTPPTDGEYRVFKEWLPKANAARKAIANKEAVGYTKTFKIEDIESLVKGIYSGQKEVN